MLSKIVEPVYDKVTSDYHCFKTLGEKFGASKLNQCLCRKNTKDKLFSEGKNNNKNKSTQRKQKKLRPRNKIWRLGEKNKIIEPQQK